MIRRADVIIIAALCVLLLGGAITAIVITNQPPPAPTAISINTGPKKTDYAKGERIDTTGLVLVAHFPSGVKDVSKGFTISPKIAEREDKQTITVTYRGKKTNYEITVNPAELLNMQLKSNPKKTSYRLEDPQPTWEGLEITLTWTDGKKTITPGHDRLEISDANMKLPGFQTITASYLDKSITFRIHLS